MCGDDDEMSSELDTLAGGRCAISRMRMIDLYFYYWAVERRMGGGVI